MNNTKGFTPVAVLIAIGVVLVLGAGGYYLLANNNNAAPAPENRGTLPEERKKGEIISLVITPSTKDGGWTMYRSGAKAVLKGKNLVSAEVRYFPTGTGIEEYRVMGQMSMTASSADGDTWELAMSKSLMTTGFWAEAKDAAGRTVKSADVGSVGYEEAPQQASLQSKAICDKIKNRTFVSLNFVGSVLTPDGDAPTRGTLRFGTSTLTLLHSDVVESGTFVCTASALEATLSGRKVSAQYDAATKQLIWNGEPYKESSSQFSYGGYSFEYPSNWRADFITYASPAMIAEGKPQEQEVVGFHVRKVGVETGANSAQEFTVSLGGPQSGGETCAMRAAEGSQATRCKDISVGMLVTFSKNMETLAVFDQIVRTLAPGKEGISGTVFRRVSGCGPAGCIPPPDEISVAGENQRITVITSPSEIVVGIYFTDKNGMYRAVVGPGNYVVCSDYYGGPARTCDDATTVVAGKFTVQDITFTISPP